jgi:hypothetical protein
LSKIQIFNKELSTEAWSKNLDEMNKIFLKALLDCEKFLENISDKSYLLSNCIENVEYWFRLITVFDELKKINNKCFEQITIKK